MPGRYRKFSKGLWTLKTKGHCCLKSCTSAWKISALLLKTMSFLLEGRRDCLHPITPSQRYALGILPNPKVPDDVLQPLDECKNKMLFKMHSLTFSLTSLTLQVCRLSLVFFKVWKNTSPKTSLQWCINKHNMSTSSAGTATSDPVLASCTATLAMRISASAGASNMLNPYYRKLSRRKEISIVLFLPFLRNFSCGVLTFFLRSTVTTWDSFAPQTWSLISFVLDP